MNTRGGMTVEDAMQLSDAYIQKCEFLNSPDRSINLQYHMILDFTGQVNTIRGGKNTSKLIHVQTDLFFTILISVIALLKLFP